MPTYTYKCPKCGHFTVQQGIKETPLSLCPTCQSPIKRVIGQHINVVLKSSGFYSTDHKG